MSEYGASEQKKRRRSRLTIVILLLISIAPAAGAWLWFHFGSGFTQKNYGVLYHPARPLSGVTFKGVDGKEMSMETIQGTWHLAYVGEGPCSEICQSKLDSMNRIRLAQTKNMRRVRSLYLSTSEQSQGTIEKIDSVMPSGTIGYLDAAEMESFKSLLLNADEEENVLLHRIYVIDPVGNLVLSYAQDADPVKISRDMARLLRVSRIG